MNHWPFVVASYAIVLVGTVIVLGGSYVAMRKSEEKAKQLSKRK